MIENDAIAGDDVRGDCPEGYRQIVEILDLRHRQREAAQDLRELLSLHEAARQPELPALDPERKFDQEILVFELAPEIEIGP